LHGAASRCASRGRSLACRERRCAVPRQGPSAVRPTCAGEHVVRPASGIPKSRIARDFFPHGRSLGADFAPRDPNLAGRAPERQQAACETAHVVGYAALGQVRGWVAGPVLVIGRSPSTSLAPWWAAALHLAPVRSAPGQSTISLCSPLCPICGFAGAIQPCN
jgi:hypothetical protein